MFELNCTIFKLNYITFGLNYTVFELFLYQIIYYVGYIYIYLYI